MGFSFMRQIRQRTMQNRLINGLNTLRFGLTEPIMLQYARARYEHLYATQLEEDPLVSVYIPTYNRAKLLMERAVPSVLAQTYKNLELVIVGDHCTDNTAELVAKIDDPRVRFYNLPKRGYRYPPSVENHWLAGPVVPANQALQMVRGKWIARVDDDDTWTAEHVEALLRFAQQNDWEFVSAQHIEERFGQQRMLDGVRARDPYYTRRALPEQDVSPKIGGVSTWLYRAYLKFFKFNLHCWRKEWNRVNDIDFSLRIFSAGVRMGFLDQVVAYVLPRPGEATIGLEAYRLTEQAKLKHFGFNDSSSSKTSPG
jgi:glycosyltransferase involved in cell wall biosynthesis